MEVLVRELDAGPTPQSLRSRILPIDVRERIYRAAADECAYKRRSGRAYDPACDLRFRWLLQWAEVLEGIRRRIDHDVDAGMRFVFLPVEYMLTGKDYAAGEKRESHTLAQGP
jgi:hypothetical protein